MPGPTSRGRPTPHCPRWPATAPAAPMVRRPAPPGPPPAAEPRRAAGRPFLRPGTGPWEGRGVDLDEVADELYAVPPEEFIALRTARQNDARAGEDKGLATAIGALPKPSTAAWVSNLLVRAHRTEIEGLVELGGLMREAQENLAGDQMRALSSQRSQLISALTRQAAVLARQH